MLCFTEECDATHCHQVTWCSVSEAGGAEVQNGYPGTLQLSPARATEVKPVLLFASKEGNKLPPALPLSLHPALPSGPLDPDLLSEPPVSLKLGKSGEMLQGKEFSGGVWTRLCCVLEQLNQQTCQKMY